MKLGEFSCWAPIRHPTPTNAVSTTTPRQESSQKFSGVLLLTGLTLFHFRQSPPTRYSITTNCSGEVAKNEARVYFITLHRLVKTDARAVEAVSKRLLKYVEQHHEPELSIPIASERDRSPATPTMPVVYIGGKVSLACMDHLVGLGHARHIYSSPDAVCFVHHRSLISSAGPHSARTASQRLRIARPSGRRHQCERQCNWACSQARHRCTWRTFVRRHETSLPALAATSPVRDPQRRFLHEGGTPHGQVLRD